MKTIKAKCECEEQMSDYEKILVPTLLLTPVLILFAGIILAVLN